MLIARMCSLVPFLMAFIFTGCTGIDKYSVTRAPFPIYLNSEAPVNVPELEYYEEKMTADDEYKEITTSDHYITGTKNYMLADVVAAFEQNGGKGSGSTMVNSSFYFHDSQGLWSAGLSWCRLSGYYGVKSISQAPDQKGKK